MERVLDQLTVFATEYGLKIIGAVLILILGRVASGLVRNIVKRLLEKAGTDATVVSFVGSFAYVLVLAFAVLAALAKFGVETASIIAVFAAAGFAIGFALQGSLANFAAGILILIFKYYRVGDFINAAGVSGSVREIRLFSTILATPDNVRIVVPSGKIFGDIVTNYSANETRRVDLVIGIGYSSDIQQAMDLIRGLMSEDERILTDPEPQIAVSELADSSVNLIARPWVKKDDYWHVKFDLTRKIKESFDRNGIEIPFPQRTVHMVSAT
jgi:small conductance mechanosensitive channel